MRRVLVLDVGSSALKAAVYEESGRLLDHAEADYGQGPGHRIDPDKWWQAAVAACTALQEHAIEAMVLTGTMENLIPLQADGATNGEAILFSDPSGNASFAALEPALKVAGAAEITGNALEPLMTGFKLASLRVAEPERFERAALFLPGSKDYLALRLTGRAVTDPTCAATTGLIDFATRDWSDRLLGAFGIARQRLPAILPAETVLGPLLQEPARALGLAPGIPVINGCGDAGATTLGSGADDPGDASLYLGTTGWVARVALDGVGQGPHPFYRLPHPLGPSTIEIAPILSAGAAAAWARSVLRLELEEADEAALLADRAPGNLLFLPYLDGERSPFLDLEVRAGFFGLSSSDGAGAMYRAVLEGVAFAIAANLEAMGGTSGRISLVGGGALSRVWPALLADAVAAKIWAPTDPLLATSFGAFRIAQAALGLADRASLFSPVAVPRSERAGRVSRMRERFDAATRFARESCS